MKNRAGSYDHTAHLNSPFAHNHNPLHFEEKCVLLLIRELPCSFASGSLTVAAIKTGTKHIMRTPWTHDACFGRIMCAQSNHLGCTFIGVRKSVRHRCLRLIFVFHNIGITFFSVGQSDTSSSWFSYRFFSTDSRGRSGSYGFRIQGIPGQSKSF